MAEQLAPRRGRDAAMYARTFVGERAYAGMCKAFVRTVFGVVPSKSPTAISCFEQADHQHRTSDPEKVPAFVPVYMNTSNPAEHVAFTLGVQRDGHRLVVSTDAGAGNTIAIVRLDVLAARWGPIIGWAEDMDDQRVWKPGPVKPVVNLAAMQRAARKDPPAPQGSAVARAQGRIVERALAREGLLDRRWVDGSWGTRTISAYAAWQRRLGFRGTDADGSPGSTSLRALGKRYGFRVK